MVINLELGRGYCWLYKVFFKEPGTLRNLGTIRRLQGFWIGLEGFIGRPRKANGRPLEVIGG